jgi:hypothetical protein
MIRDKAMSPMPPFATGDADSAFILVGCVIDIKEYLGYFPNALSLHSAEDLNERRQFSVICAGFY